MIHELIAILNNGVTEQEKIKGETEGGKKHSEKQKTNSKWQT